MRERRGALQQGTDQRGFADASRSPHRETPRTAKHVEGNLEFALPAHHITGQAQRHGGIDVRPGRRGAARLIDQGHGEAVSDARHRRNRIGAEHLAQTRDLHLQVRLLDDEVRPNPVHQLLLANEPVSALDQRFQQVEGPRSQSDAVPVAQEAALRGAQLESTESKVSRHPPP